MSAWRYTYAGVDVVSAIELPEWTSFTTAPTTAAADVLITRTGPLTAADCPVYECTGDARKLTFSLPKVGRYTIQAGREIMLTPYAGATEAELRLFLLGSAWGALGYQRGWFPLHAGVVQVGEGAVAFCAPAGNGKSSLAAWLVKQGYTLCSDDLCRLDVLAGQVPRVWRSVPRLKLWQDALAALDWQDQPLTRDQRRLHKFHLPVPTPVAQKAEQPQTLPLRAIYVLEWGELSLQRLTGLHAVSAILTAATYRPEFIEVLGQKAAYWQRTIALVNQVPIFRLRRPRDWTAMAAVGEVLMDHVKTI